MTSTLEAIEGRTGAKFAPLRYKKWQRKDELPAALLEVKGAKAFHYPVAVLENTGVEEASELVDRGNDLPDHFPYNDRRATGSTFRGADGVFLAELEIEGWDGDSDEVVLYWQRIDEGALFVIASVRAKVEAVVGALPALEGAGDLDVTLGHG